MGANQFMAFGMGKTARAAFRIAVEEAQHRAGNGYSGTIAEKNEFVMISYKSESDGDEGARKFAQSLLSKNDKRVEDKWGPCGCLEVFPPDGFEEGNHGEGRFLFFGFAPS